MLTLREGDILSEQIYFNGLRPKDKAGDREYKLLERVVNNDAAHNALEAAHNPYVNPHGGRGKLNNRSNCHKWFAVCTSSHNAEEVGKYFFIWERDCRNRMNGFKVEVPEVQGGQIVASDTYYYIYCKLGWR